MIERALFEWSSLRYGDEANCIPWPSAERLAAVANGTELARRMGAAVLSLGREELRSASVVGVIAVDDSVLEILPKIDTRGTGDREAATRRQLVHMLAEVFDLEIAPGAITELGWQRDSLLEILIGLFTRRLSDALRHGMPRQYLGHEEDLGVLRGRLDTTRQFTNLLTKPQLLACRYDALSPDIALNQLMKAAVVRLSRLARSNENQRQLREQAFAYADITPAPPSMLRNAPITIDRTNRSWRELVGLARLLLGDRFQNTSIGEERGFALLFDMNALFEEYIGRLIRRLITSSLNSVHLQGGRRFCLEEVTTRRQSFMTVPDVILMRDGTAALIVDTKWKRIVPNSGDPRRGVSPDDVYQMMAYGRVYGCSELMLLYPHHDAISGPSGIQADHRILGGSERLRVATVDLSAPRLTFASLASVLSSVLNQGTHPTKPA